MLLNGLCRVILAVDSDFVLQSRIVRNIDFDGSVPEGLHQLVILELSIFWFIGVANDHFVDRSLRKSFWLDGLFLARTQKIVKECDIELENLDELNHAPIGDVEFPIKVERSGI